MLLLQRCPCSPEETAILIIVRTRTILIYVINLTICMVLWILLIRWHVLMVHQLVLTMWAQFTRSIVLLLIIILIELLITWCCWRAARRSCLFILISRNLLFKDDHIWILICTSVYITIVNTNTSIYVFIVGKHLILILKLHLHGIIFWPWRHLMTAIGISCARWRRF